MADALTLIGFRYSVYTRILRMALIEMGLTARYVETDPFAEIPDPVLAAHSPFGRVPVLQHDEFTLTETATILRYLDTLAPHSLIPANPKAAARMGQVMGIIDAYGYVPLVRKVFSHGAYRPRMGQPFDPAQVGEGMQAAIPVLATLESVAAEGFVLAPQALTLADLHLAPMIAYFAEVPQGAAALATYPALSAWWRKIALRPSLIATDPFAAH